MATDNLKLLVDAANSAGYSVRPCRVEGYRFILRREQGRFKGQKMYAANEASGLYLLALGLLARLHYVQAAIAD